MAAFAGLQDVAETHYIAGVGEIGKRLRAGRRAKNLTIEELATATGVSARTISYIEGGRKSTFETLSKLAAPLEVQLEATDVAAPSTPDGRLPMPVLDLGPNFQIVDPNPRVVRLKVRAHVAAGHGGWDDDVGDEWVDVPEILLGPNDFIVQAKGQSMEDEGIFDGDYVLVTRVPPNMAPTGDIVIAWLNDGLVIKRWARRDGRKVLYSASEGWGEREVLPDDVFEIQAVVKYWWRSAKRRLDLARVPQDTRK